MNMSRAILCLSLILLFVCIIAAHRHLTSATYSDAGRVSNRIQAVRFKQNPIISTQMGHGIGENINGPSLIKVPTWLHNPLGKYYLYFAHHTGTFIRLAYADKLQGPWSIYEPGTLKLNDDDLC